MDDPEALSWTYIYSTISISGPRRTHCSHLVEQKESAAKTSAEENEGGVVQMKQVGQDVVHAIQCQRRWTDEHVLVVVVCIRWPISGKCGAKDPETGRMSSARGTHEVALDFVQH